MHILILGQTTSFRGENKKPQGKILSLVCVISRGVNRAYIPF